MQLRCVAHYSRVHVAVHRADEATGGRGRRPMLAIGCTGRSSSWLTRPSSPRSGRSARVFR